MASSASLEQRGLSRSVPRSEPISPRDFLGTWGIEAHDSTRVKKMKPDDMLKSIAEKMSLPDETVRELSEVCGKDTPMTGKEPRNKLNMLQLKEVPEDVNLASVEYQMEQNRLRQENEAVKLMTIRYMKYNSNDEYMAVIPSDVSREDFPPEFRVQQPNVILAVEVTRCLLHGHTVYKVRESETYQILATQTLSELRDKIKCSSDHVIPGDYSAMPDVDPQSLQTAADLYKSSFFFIENVFYNDFRLPDNKDYSKPIIKWASEHMPGSEMSTADMATTQFLDLNIRLGHHYLYTHQGNCEHSVLFTDMRLFTATDIQDMRLYPYLSVTRVRKRCICQGCQKLSAKWVVLQSPLIPTDPCYLCKLCFKTLLYTKDGQKTSNFKAYHFTDHFPGNIKD